MFLDAFILKFELSMIFAKKPALPNRIAMTDAPREIDPLKQLAMLTAGDALIFRHYELDKRERLFLGQSLRNACRDAAILFMVAEDQKLGLRLRADGLHLPGWALRQGYHWRRRAHPKWIISGAVHSTRELILAEHRGVDIAILSPVFPTKSHPAAKSLGVIGAAGLSQQTSLPVYALGGMNETSAHRLRGLSVEGYAFVSPD